MGHCTPVCLRSIQRCLCRDTTMLSACFAEQHKAVRNAFFLTSAAVTSSFLAGQRLPQSLNELSSFSFQKHALACYVFEHITCKSMLSHRDVTVINGNVMPRSSNATPCVPMHSDFHYYCLKCTASLFSSKCIPLRLNAAELHKVTVSWLSHSFLRRTRTPTQFGYGH